MSIWNSLFGWMWSSDDSTAPDSSDAFSEKNSHCTINPATGLPMVGDCGGVDVAGNPYGTDMHADHTIFSSNDDWSSNDWMSGSSSSSDWDSSSWSSSSSSWDD